MIREQKDSRGQIKNAVSIDERPEIVEEKNRIGDWEIDTVIGKNHKQALVTIVERKSKFTVMKKVENKTAELVAATTIELLRPFYQQQIEACDIAIEQQLHTLSSKGDSDDLPPSKKSKGKNSPAFDMRKDLHRITGVDLIQIDGMNENSVLKILA